MAPSCCPVSTPISTKFLAADRRAMRQGRSRRRRDTPQYALQALARPHRHRARCGRKPRRAVGPRAAGVGSVAAGGGDRSVAATRGRCRFRGACRRGAAHPYHDRGGERRGRGARHRGRAARGSRGGKNRRARHAGSRAGAPRHRRARTVGDRRGGFSGDPLTDTPAGSSPGSPPRRRLANSPR